MNNSAINLNRTVIVFGTLVLCGALMVLRIREYASTDLDFQAFLRLLSWGGTLFITGMAFVKHGWKWINQHDYLLGLFLILALALVPFSVDPVRTLMTVISYGSFYLGIRFLYLRYGLDGVIVTLGCAGGVLLVLSYFYYFFLPELGRHIYWFDSVLLVSSRMSGTFTTSNAMGGFAAVMLLLIQRLHQRQIFSLRYLLVLMLIALGALLLSNSKTASVAWAVSALIMLPKSSFKTMLLFAGAFVVVCAGVFILSDPMAFLVMLSRHGDPNELLSLTGRVDIWPVAWELAWQQPLTGIGLGTTSAVMPEFSDVVGYSTSHAHNLVLQAFLCMGVFGAGLIAIIVLYNLFHASVEPLSNGFAVYLLITAMFESSFLSGVAGYSMIPLVVMCVCKQR